MTPHPIFAKILAPYAGGPSPDSHTGKALGKLGVSIALKELRDHERELTRHMDCGERLTSQIEELQAEATDDTQPDYARDLAVHKLTRARNERAGHIAACVWLIREITDARAILEKPEHFMSMLAAELRR